MNARESILTGVVTALSATLLFVLAGPDLDRYRAYPVFRRVAVCVLCVLFLVVSFSAIKKTI